MLRINDDDDTEEVVAGILASSSIPSCAVRIGSRCYVIILRAAVSDQKRGSALQYDSGLRFSGATNSTGKSGTM
jgi:hypothetical protein